MSDLEAVVVVSANGPLLTITIDRPAKRNAVDGRVAVGIASALARLDDDDSLRVAVLTGAGGTFSAGADLGAISRGESNAVPGAGFAGIVEAPPRKPLIAAAEGPALGGGFEIVLACDLVVAGTSARFGLPEVRRGLIARGGGAFRLPARLPRAIALEILLTGDPISAGRAYELGLVKRVVADGAALAAAQELAGTIAANAPLSVTTSKAIADVSRLWPEAESFALQRAQADSVFASADAREGATAFLERRQPVWTGRSRPSCNHRYGGAQPDQPGRRA
jgi:enoyl-CoA hydratase